MWWPTTTTQRTTTTTTTRQPSSIDFEPPQAPAAESTCTELFAPNPNDCNKYYLCDNGRPLVQSCPPGLHWNKNLKICDWPESAGCQSGSVSLSDPNKPTTSPRPTTTTTRKPRPPPPTNIISDINETDDGKFKIVCYFTNWAWYRPGEGKYLPENIDENLCTHIVYGFAVLDGTTLTIKSHDSWADIDNNFYERVLAFREKGLKVLIAIGGWNDSLGDKYRFACLFTAPYNVHFVNECNSRMYFFIYFLQSYGVG